MKRNWTTVGFGGTILGLLYFASAARAAESQASPEIRRLVAAAKEAGERELQVAWPEGSLGGQEGAKRYESLFNRMYGTNIKVQYTPHPSIIKLAGIVAQEVLAGHPPSTDILIGAEGNFAALVKQKVMEEYDYTKLSSRIPKEIVAPENIAVEIASRISGITYNTNLVAPNEVPRKLEDVLNPKWKGKIASTPGATGFERVSMRPEWSAEKMRDFLSRLSRQVAGLIFPGEVARVASGEFLMLVLDSGGHQARKVKATGAPLGHVIPEDGAVLNFQYLGVPRLSAHPNLAKLFIYAVLSEEGQKLHYEVAFHDHYLLPGSTSAAELKDLKSKGAQMLRADVQFVLRHPEMRQRSVDFEKILRREEGKR